MSKIEQVKIPVSIEEPKYELLRLEDGLVKKGTKLNFLEWNEDGTYKKHYPEPQIGFSCILDGHRMDFTWMTTTITEIVDQQENYIKFKTQNSTYELRIK